MLTPDERKLVADVTKITQIIVFALLTGAASYLTFVIFSGGEPPQERGNLAPLAAASAVAGIVAGLVVSRMMAAQQRRSPAAQPASGSSNEPSTRDATTLLGGFQVRRIVQAAMIEGPAYFNIVAYQQERQTYSLAVAAALMACLIMLLPLRPLVENWLEREQVEVRRLRDRGE